MNPLEQQFKALQASAQRTTTPCGQGSVAWHMWGPEDGAPLLLLHGGSGSWTHWVRNIDTLTALGRRVIVPDLPGFGDSTEPPEGHDPEPVMSWLEVGAKQLLGEQSVEAVGFSYGGMTIGLWAAQYPQRLTRLVFVGAPGLSDHWLPRPTVLPWRGAAEGAERDAVHRHNLLSLLLIHNDRIDDATLRLHAANVARDRLRKRSTDLQGKLTAHLPKFDIPVSAIYGANDNIFSSDLKAIEAGLQTAPGFRALTVIERMGHWVPFEDADNFNRILTQHLRL